MTTFIVEHLHNGYPMFDTVTGVEDIDLTMFKNIQTLWVCDTKEEIETAVKKMCEMHNIDFKEILSPFPKIPNRSLKDYFAGLSIKEVGVKALKKFKFVSQKIICKLNLYKTRKSSVQNTTEYGVYNIYDAVLLLNFFLKENGK